VRIRQPGKPTAPIYGLGVQADRSDPRPLNAPESVSLGLRAIHILNGEKMGQEKTARKQRTERSA